LPARWSPPTPSSSTVTSRGETIAAIGEGAPPPAAETIGLGGNCILPGLVDGHMHTSSSTGWPGIETATRCAAAGGATTCCDMPYDVPAPATDAAILADKIGWVQRSSHVDMAQYGTVLKTGTILKTDGLDAIVGLGNRGIGQSWDWAIARLGNRATGQSRDWPPAA
jgi:allantoinase